MLPIIMMELIDDGRHTYNKFNDAIQNADITFTMVNEDNGVTKVAKAPAYIKLKEDFGCTDKYIICYNWKKHDTLEAGNFVGTFEIKFGDDLTSDDTTYPTGNLIMPIREELKIIILNQVIMLTTKSLSNDFYQYGEQDNVSIKNK